MWDEVGLRSAPAMMRRWSDEQQTVKACCGHEDTYHSCLTEPCHKPHTCCTVVGVQFGDDT